MVPSIPRGCGRRQCCCSTSEGKEHVRLEGYLPNEYFQAALESGLGRIAFVHRNYADAERWYNSEVARFGSSHSVAEAW
jgi:hypothetical protein